MKLINFITALLLISCTGNNCNVSNSYPSNIKLVNYIDTIYNINNVNDFSRFVFANKEALFSFYEVNDSLSFNQKKESIFSLIDNIYFDSLYEDVIDKFITPEFLFNDFNNSIGLFNSQSNLKLTPKLNIIISGFYNDIVVEGNNITVGLEYFLDKNNKFKPRDLPSYILDRYTPEYLNSTILTTYLSQYNFINELDKTMINEIISFGKLYYVVTELLKCSPERVVLGYTEDEFNLLENNETFIYSFFLQNELLFQESDQIKQKYISERPSTFEIAESVPGRVGRWLGWKIVSSYMKNSTYTLEELLKEDDYKNIFYNSNYNPL